LSNIFISTDINDSYLAGLSRHVKRLFQRTEFQTAEELLEAEVQILSDIPLETLMSTFHQWMERLQACIDGYGEYVEERSILFQKFLIKSKGN
jgi:hypothetical protein